MGIFVSYSLTLINGGDTVANVLNGLAYIQIREIKNIFFQQINHHQLGKSVNAGLGGKRS